MNAEKGTTILAECLFAVSARKTGMEVLKISPASLFFYAYALILSFTLSSCRALTRTDYMESGAAEKVTHSQAPRVPGFTYLREETFSCGGQTNTMQIYHHDRTGLEFVLVPGGVFRMGADTDELKAIPVHTVKVKPFLLCRTECTQAAWDKIGGNDDRTWKGPDLPIEWVNWYDVTAWCRKAGLRLPTEAEWEYACRAGTTTRFCFGNSDSDLGDYAWYGHKYGDRTHPVGQKKPNAFGLYDMHGNVSEWCQDVFHESYSGAPNDGSAWESSESSVYSPRIIRGGNWYYGPFLCLSACREGIYKTKERDCYMGFRPAADVPSGN